MKILHLNGALDINNVLARPGVNEALQRLFNNETTAKNIEKLKGHNVYSLRISKTDRLLFSLVEMNRKVYCVLFEYVENHRYDKASTLKLPVLKNYADGIDAILDEVADTDWDEVESTALDEVLAASDNNEPLTYHKVEYFNQQFIELSEEQELLTQDLLPAVIKGPPGSGKSTLVPPMVTNIFKHHKDENKTLCYVARSKELATKMQKSWSDLPVAQDEVALKVRFLSLDELKREQDARVGFYTLATKTDFEQWYEIQKQHSKNQSKSKSSKGRRNKRGRQAVAQDPLSAVKSSEQLRTEFNIISGYADNNFKEYLSKNSNIGKKDTAFFGEDRKLIVELYKKYHAWLQKKHKVDLAYLDTEISDQYDWVIVDESQDLTTKELYWLAQLAKGNQIAYLMDKEQSSDNELSLEKYIQHYFANLQVSLTQGQLRSSYRSPRLHIQLANIVLRLKQHLLGGVERKDDYRQIEVNEQQDSNGSIRMIESITDEYFSQLQAQYGIEEVAIVAPEGQIESIKSKYDTSLVYSVDKIKGLEFKCVIACDFLSGSKVQKIDQELKRQPFDQAVQKNNRSKTRKNFDFVTYLNQLFVTFTRSTVDLVIAQTKNHDNARVYDYFHSHIQRLMELPVDVQVSNDSKSKIISNEAKTYKKACLLIRNNQIEQAKGLLAKIGYDEHKIAQTINLETNANFTVATEFTKPKRKRSTPSLKVLREVSVPSKKNNQAKILEAAKNQLLHVKWNNKSRKRFKDCLSKIEDIAAWINDQCPSLLHCAIKAKNIEAIELILDQRQSLDYVEMDTCLEWIYFIASDVVSEASRKCYLSLLINVLGVDGIEKVYECIDLSKLSLLAPNLYKKRIDEIPARINNFFEMLLEFYKVTPVESVRKLLEREVANGKTVFHLIGLLRSDIALEIRKLANQKVGEGEVEAHFPIRSRAKKISEPAMGKLLRDFKPTTKKDAELLLLMCADLDAEERYNVLVSRSRIGMVNFMLLAVHCPEEIPKIFDGMNIKDIYNLLAFKGAFGNTVLIEALEICDEAIPFMWQRLDAMQRYRLMLESSNNQNFINVLVSGHGWLVSGALQGLDKIKVLKLLLHRNESGQHRLGKDVTLKKLINYDPEYFIELLLQLENEDLCIDLLGIDVDPGHTVFMWLLECHPIAAINLLAALSDVVKQQILLKQSSDLASPFIIVIKQVYKGSLLLEDFLAVIPNELFGTMMLQQDSSGLNPLMYALVCKLREVDALLNKCPDQYRNQVLLQQNSQHESALIVAYNYHIAAIPAVLSFIDSIMREEIVSQHEDNFILVFLILAVTGSNAFLATLNVLDREVATQVLLQLDSSVIEQKISCIEGASMRLHGLLAREMRMHSKVSAKGEGGFANAIDAQYATALSRLMVRLQQVNLPESSRSPGFFNAPSLDPDYASDSNNEFSESYSAEEDSDLVRRLK